MERILINRGQATGSDLDGRDAQASDSHVDLHLPSRRITVVDFELLHFGQLSDGLSFGREANVLFKAGFFELEEFGVDIPLHFFGLLIFLFDDEGRMKELLHLLMGGRVEVVDVLIVLILHQELHESVLFLFNFCRCFRLDFLHVREVDFEPFPFHFGEQLAEGPPESLVDLPCVLDPVVGRRLLFP